MAHNDFIGIIVTLIISLILIIFGIILISGKGAFFISGYNTLSLTEKKSIMKSCCADVWESI